MTEKELIKNLKNYGKGFRKETEITKQENKELRSLIMSKIGFNDIVKESFVSRLAENIATKQLVLKPVGAFSLIMVLFVIFSFATVNASRNTLPDSPLYNFKIAAEKVRYILAFSEEDRARMSMDIAERRAKEFVALVSRIDKNGSQENALTAAQVTLEIKSYLTDVKAKFSKINQEEKDAVKVVAMADSINENIKSIEQAVGSVESDDLKNNAKEVLEQTGDIKLVVLTALIDRYTAGEIELSEEKLQEAKNLIDDTSNKNIEEIDNLKNLDNDKINNGIISGPAPTSTPTSTQPIIAPKDPYFSDEEWTLENDEIDNKEFEVLIK
ncbi:MAG: DUF5667 domain-containing protein [Patescibacteria group bacterium]